MCFVMYGLMSCEKLLPTNINEIEVYRATVLRNRYLEANHIYEIQTDKPQIRQYLDIYFMLNLLVVVGTFLNLVGFIRRNITSCVDT